VAQVREGVCLLETVPLLRDLGSTGKDATPETAKQPTYIDATIGNINFNPVVKFQKIITLNQFMGNIDNGYYTHETFIVMAGWSSRANDYHFWNCCKSFLPNCYKRAYGIGFGNFSSV
jgi:hypothetical protein